MPEHFWFFTAGLASSILSGRAHAIIYRSGMRGARPSPTFDKFVVAGTTLNLVALPALMVWGFAALSWYYPIALFLGLMFFAGILVTQSTLPFFALARPAFALLAAGSAATCWLA